MLSLGHGRWWAGRRNLRRLEQGVEFATKQVQDLHLVIGEGRREISKTDALCSLSSKQDPKSSNFR